MHALDPVGAGGPVVVVGHADQAQLREDPWPLVVGVERVRLDVLQELGRFGQSLRAHHVLSCPGRHVAVDAEEVAVARVVRPVLEVAPVRVLGPGHGQDRPAADLLPDVLRQAVDHREEAREVVLVLVRPALQVTLRLVPVGEVDAHLRVVEDPRGHVLELLVDVLQAVGVPVDLAAEERDGRVAPAVRQPAVGPGRENLPGATTQGDVDREDPHDVVPGKQRLVGIDVVSRNRCADQHGYHLRTD